MVPIDVALNKVIMTTALYKINASKVAQETIDGEVVIIHLDRGHYYSLLKTGAEIWSGIERGETTSHIVTELLQSYTGDRTEVEQAVTDLLSQLQQEELIVPDTAVRDISTEESEATFEGASDKPAFEPPILEKYTDMEDLLLLDPIHEVDGSGWPHAKSA